MVAMVCQIGRRALVVFLLLGLLSVGSVVASTPAQAEVYTCGNTSEYNYHAGYLQQTYDTTYNGAGATIITEYGAVCDTVTGHANFTNEYSMIAGYNDIYDFGGWAQSGYIRWYGSYIYFFAQQNDGVGDISTVYGTSPLSVGSSYTYKQHYYSSCGCVKSWEDDTVLLTSSWNPYDYWDEFSVQFDAETAYLESDIAGNAASPTIYTTIGGELQSTDLFTSIPCNFLTHDNDGGKERSDGESWWDRLTGSCPDFESYTDTAG